MNVLLAPESSPFLIASLVLLAIAAVEGLGLIVGASASQWLDHWLSGSDAQGGPADGIAASWLGWLHVGKVPLLALIVVLLAAFAVLGFGLNIVVHGLFGAYVPPLVAAPLALVAALPVVRVTGGVLGRIMPREETSAVSIDSLVGRIATVVSGTARHGYPAQARVTSEHGQTIYVMVEPDSPQASFGSGEPVLLVKRLRGTRFQGIRNPKPDLL
ncbi:MAG TPA: OB-fold-containig protein [Burkholderiales bacterium]|nr:OB-fold-containig protein [Burkholderiales bacterium]